MACVMCHVVIDIIIDIGIIIIIIDIIIIIYYYYYY